MTAADVSLTGVVFNEGFGRSLAIDDLDGDGLPDLVVGAPRAPVGSEGPGHAYVFVAPLDRGSRPASTADTIVEGAQISDSFGIAVMTGDLTGDARPISRSGRTSCSAAAAPAGRMPSTGRSPPVCWRRLLPTPCSSANPLTRSDLSGNALAAAGHDGDGVEDLAIAGSSSDAGGVRSGRTWLLFGPLPASGTASDADLLFTGRRFDLLGQSVANAGDLDRDGSEELLVGAPGFYDDEPDRYVWVVLGHPRL